MAIDQPFPRGTFKVEPGKHEVSVLFKPTQSTIVFTITTDANGRAALAQGYRVHPVKAGQFGRFDETEVVEAARKLALPFAGKAGPG